MNRMNTAKLKIIMIVISSFVLLACSLLTSCSQKPLPYVFEGVMQVGVENVPPVAVILDTELPVVPDKLPVYKVETVDEEYIAALASRLGFKGKPSQPTDSNMPYTYVQGSDFKSGTRLPDGTQWIEVYKNGSLRLLTQTSIKNVPKSLPSFEEAEKIARDWLVSHDLYPANVASVKKGGGLVVTSVDTGVSIAYSLIVRFQTKLGDYDIYTPAASVEVGENGKILSANINMTQIKEYGFVTLKTPESALNLLKAHLASPLANPPESRESVINLRSFERLSVTQVTLQYTNGGGYLQPIYVFEGSAYSTRNTSLETFKGKVDAVAR